mmetsp:Transcript_82898/g.173568  ORF Transcript_82898/g.173568 Transcript_82898/m.173568 type:complete len:238 (+) Transcript_82898:130-843(+)
MYTWTIASTTKNMASTMVHQSTLEFVDSAVSRCTASRVMANSCCSRMSNVFRYSCATDSCIWAVWFWVTNCFNSLLSERSNSCSRPHLQSKLIIWLSLMVLLKQRAKFSPALCASTGFNWPEGWFNLHSSLSSGPSMRTSIPSSGPSASKLPTQWWPDSGLHLKHSSVPGLSSKNSAEAPPFRSAAASRSAALFSPAAARGMTLDEDRNKNRNKNKNRLVRSRSYDTHTHKHTKTNR